MIKSTLALFFVTLLALPALAVMRVELKPQPKSVLFKKGDKSCVRGIVGSLVFDGPGGSEYFHNKILRLQVLSAADGGKTVIGNITIGGYDTAGGLAFSALKGKPIVLCTDGSFVL